MEKVYITVSARGIFKEIMTTETELEETIKALKEAGLIRKKADYYITRTTTKEATK